MTTAVLYTRADCPLCFVLRRQAERASRHAGLPLRVVDVDSDAALRERYGEEVPVLELPGGVSIRGRAAAAEVEAAFARVMAAGNEPPGSAHRPITGWIRRILGARLSGR